MASSLRHQGRPQPPLSHQSPSTIRTSHSRVASPLGHLPTLVDSTAPSRVFDTEVSPDLWIHCNKCKVLTSPAFWLTECAHVLCQQCLPSQVGMPAGLASAQKEAQCPVCFVLCLTVPLDGELSPAIQRYFTPTHELLDELVEVIKFQLKNTGGLVHHLRTKNDRQKQVLKRAKEELLHMKELKKQVRELQAERHQWLARFQAMTIHQASAAPQPVLQQIFHVQASLTQVDPFDQLLNRPLLVLSALTPHLAPKE
ncbi:hypothetical protein H4R35_004037 [Dimargaris xerosporica]|nr:hypothetical protein H4R35_004037 [Dimargaris xerosporica]